MVEALIRLAGAGDVAQLVELRREFAFEDVAPENAVARPGYDEDFRSFLREALATGRWQIWVAEIGERIAAHAFVALIEKVPRPDREPATIAYLTNVYTRPPFRRQGLGEALIRRAQDAARDADVELMIVWPSDESVDFYEREGFARPIEPLIWEPR